MTSCPACEWWSAWSRRYPHGRRDLESARMLETKPTGDDRNGATPAEDSTPSTTPTRRTRSTRRKATAPAEVAAPAEVTAPPAPAEVTAAPPDTGTAEETP